MIIDTHVHIGSSLGFDLKAEDVLYSMDKYGIDFSLVSDISCAEFDHMGKPVPKEFQISQNESLKNALSFAAAHPERIGIMPWLKIHSELPDSEFISLIEQNRALIYGIKLHPFHSRVAPDDPALEPIYDLAERFSLPVVSHTGGCEEARSVHLYNAAKKHPKVKFVMVHMDLGTDNSEALDLLGKADNLYGDTTWVPVHTTVSAVEKYGSGKMLFGSDNPIDGPDTYYCNRTGDRSLYQEYFNELRAIISPEDYDNIMYRNAARIFGIKLCEV